MLELMDKSPKVRRFMWTALFIVLIYILPNFITSIADFWIKVRG
ncbi:hypothetical protein [Rodentibacter trehalosifermentans]|nr:hypothetical protein [Rodentibacter trehalosifermentans]